MNIPQQFVKKLETIDSVATLPAVAIEILATLRQDQTSMKQVARIVERDPSVTAKILKVANSPLWGFMGRVESAQRAITLLGIKQVSNIVIAISLYSTFAKLKPNPHFDRSKFWQHSVATGHIARKLAQTARLNFQGEEFIAGLLHDIGKMVLDQFWSEDFCRISEEATLDGKSILAVEKATLGCTHAEIGALLLENWRFPASIKTVVQFHHDVAGADQFRPLVALVSVADILCEESGIGFDADMQRYGLLEQPAWKILQADHALFKKMDLEAFRQSLTRDLEIAGQMASLITV